MGKDKKREQARKLAELQGPAPSDDEIGEEEFNEEMEQLEARQQVGDIREKEVEELAQGKNSRDLSLMHRRPIIYAPTTGGDGRPQPLKLVPEDSDNERELVEYGRGRIHGQKQRKRRATAKKKKKEKEEKEEIERRQSFRGCGELMKPGSRKPGGGAGGGGAGGGGAHEGGKDPIQA
jgi:hypothetical protein